MKKVRLRRTVWCLHLALFEQIYCDPHRWQTNNRAIRSMNQQNQATHDSPILPRGDLSRPGSATAQLNLPCWESERPPILNSAEALLGLSRGKGTTSRKITSGSAFVPTRIWAISVFT